MEQILKNRGIKKYGFVSFDNVKLLNTRSRSRLPDGAKSVAVIIYPYYSPGARVGNISAYCSVTDYHDIIGLQLKSISRQLKEKYPEDEFVPFVDSSPIAEVDRAVKAGLGVRGDNGLLINREWGSFVFIGEIVTTLDITSTCCEDKGCLKCGRCRKACPGGAICRGSVDGGSCASHISQKKGELTGAEAGILKKARTVFGCDICQTVCPMNKKVVAEGGYTPAFEGDGKPATCFDRVVNAFRTDIVNTVTEENAPLLYKDRAFGFRGLPVLLRNLKIYNEDK